MAFPKIPTGIDMSHYQHLVDIGKTPREIVLWSTKATEGKRFVDPNFAASWAAFHAAPWIRYRGAYHWIRPDSDVRVQAKHFLATVGPLAPGDLLQLDWERTYVVDDKTKESVPLRWLGVDEIEAFIEVIEDAVGPRWIVYGADWVEGFTQWRRASPNAPVWYAAYNADKGEMVASNYGAAVWQYAGGGIPVSGFTPPTDGAGQRTGFQWPDLNKILRRDVLDSVAGLSSQAPVAVVAPVAVGAAVVPNQWAPAVDIERRELVQVSSAPPVDSVRDGSNVLWLQLALIKAGCRSQLGTFDAIALRSFQEASGLPSTGAYDQATAEKLNSAVA